MGSFITNCEHYNDCNWTIFHAKIVLKALTQSQFCCRQLFGSWCQAWPSLWVRQAMLSPWCKFILFRKVYKSAPLKITKMERNPSKPFFQHDMHHAPRRKKREHKINENKAVLRAGFFGKNGTSAFAARRNDLADSRVWTVLGEGH